MKIHAHSLRDRDESLWELLSDHLARVGELAGEFARPFGGEEIARAEGLLHDIGKCAAAYQRYIRELGSSPDHSTAGAFEAFQRYGPLFGRLMAFAIAGHHAGLVDGTGDDGPGRSLEARLKDAGALPDYAGWQAHIPQLTGQVALSRKLAATGNTAFSLAFLGRMLFSCLVDADFLATEEFYAEARGEKIERGGHGTIEALRARLDIHMAKLAAAAGRTPLNALRAEILAHARGQAALAPGLFTMTVPTGGGKTLASLAFALDHAVAHGLRRVIYVIPYTSIIEQTAGIFREALGDANVLEHHGNFDWERTPNTEEQGQADAEAPDGLRKLRRAAENWDVPVVVTTAVQFFESLFAARTSRCRKLHNLTGSVIILDEAQMLPLDLLHPCMAAIDELAKNYGASIVLCTATQPALRRQDRVKDGLDIDGLDIPDGRELAPRPPELYEKLRRVTVEHVGSVTDAEIAARFAEQGRMLCIVNSRAHAQALFAEIEDMPGARHLTTLMCPAHRRAVLAEVREALKAERPVRLVSTSLIEAGVDVDFPEVWRAETGLDSIAQAAGRCNREGRLAQGRTVVFTSADHKLPAMFGQAASATRNVLRHHGGDPLGLDAVRAYFTELYWTKGAKALDAATRNGKPFPIMEKLHERRDTFLFPYAGIAAAFRMIDDEMEPVIVPWRSGRDPEEYDRLLAALRTPDRPPGATLRKLQQYTVTVPRKAYGALLGSGAVQPVLRDYGDRFVHLTSESLYDARTGLRLDPFGMTAEAGMF